MNTKERLILLTLFALSILAILLAVYPFIVTVAQLLKDILRLFILTLGQPLVATMLEGIGI